MLRINRVKVEINTAIGMYGFDTKFEDGLTFLASEENTYGKSSILEAIYYCLGFEEIIGGKGEKVLTSVYKNAVVDGDKVWNVLQSSAYLEISNGVDVVTLFRPVKMEKKDSRMITVFYSNMDEIANPETAYVDTYVHFPNSAQNEKGFHSFLEKFLFLELPRVTASDDTQRKLYLQLVFSCMFIEQKHGWSDLFSGMPILGIKESKKRVIEFVLKLDTLENDKLKEQLKRDEALITREWEECNKLLQVAAMQESCSVKNFPPKPKILTEAELERIAIANSDGIISVLIPELEKQASELKRVKPKVVDNFNDLQHELEETETEITRLSQHVIECRSKLLFESKSIQAIEDNLESVTIDLSNNKDAARLRNLGSELQFGFAKDTCPVCHQRINDSLLPISIDTPVMSIDENIRHLEAQKEMLTFAKSSRKRHIEELRQEIEGVEGRLFTLRRLAQTIRNDLYSLSEDYSESVIYKKVTIEKQIEVLNRIQRALAEAIAKLKELSSRWSKYLQAKSALPASRFTKADEDKLKLLRKRFIQNLQKYGYRSIHNLNEIEISMETYLPLFEGFDMKFDSSASDNIRVIWAFTMALLQVSLETEGNHPTVLIFDEPDQQSTIISDMSSFFDSIICLSDKCQVIMGITLKDSDTKNVIEKLPKEKYKRVNVPNKAFQLQKENKIERGMQDD